MSADNESWDYPAIGWASDTGFRLDCKCGGFHAQGRLAEVVVDYERHLLTSEAHDFVTTHLQEETNPAFEEGG